MERQWYWDHRTEKAYYPVDRDDDTVTLVSVWHRDEVRDAIETGALDDVADVSGDQEGFNHFESFRFPDEPTFESLSGGTDE